MLGALFADGIDAALTLDGKAYFLKGNQCVRYDLSTQKADHGKIALEENHPLHKVLQMQMRNPTVLS